MMCSQWEQFWFEEIPAILLSTFRMVHCATLFLFLAAWWRHAPEWLTTKGFHFSDELLPPLAGWGLPILACVQFGSLVLLFFGWRTRTNALISIGCLTYVTLIDRVAAYSINSIYLYSLAVLAAYSRHPDHAGRIPATPIRLLQIALVVIYFSSGWNKAVYGDWLDSPTTLWTTMQGVYMTDAAAWSVRHIPIPFWAILQYTVLAFELFSPVLFSSRQTRFFAILAGCAFHLGIALFMDKLIFFSLQMMSFYVLFWNGPLAFRTAFRGKPAGPAAGEISPRRP